MLLCSSCRREPLYRDPGFLHGYHGFLWPLGIYSVFLLERRLKLSVLTPVGSPERPLTSLSRTGLRFQSCQQALLFSPSLMFCLPGSPPGTWRYSLPDQVVLPETDHCSLCATFIVCKICKESSEMGDQQGTRPSSSKVQGLDLP